MTVMGAWQREILFMQPTLWDPARMAITGVALAFVAQRTKSTWPGIVGHSCGNLAFFLNLLKGVFSFLRQFPHLLHSVTKIVLPILRQ